MTTLASMILSFRSISSFQLTAGGSLPICHRFAKTLPNEGTRVLQQRDM